MKPSLVLAFLANRYPAAYLLPAICARINKSGALDKPVTETEVEDALRALEKKGLVQLDVDKIDGTPVWSSTNEGVSVWILGGRPFGG